MVGGKKYLIATFIIICIFFLIYIAATYSFYSKNTNTKTYIQNPTTSEIALVTGFPEFPVYPSAKLKESERNGDGYQSAWSSQDSVREIADWYLAQAEQLDDWEVKEPPDEGYSAEHFMIVTSDNWKYSIIVEKYSDSQTTTIEAEIYPMKN